MRHRIVQYRGKRYSLKLHDLVWRSLEETARGSGMRLNQLVARIAADSADESSITGALRLFCLERALDRAAALERRLDELRLTARGAPLALIAEACPVPCLILSEDHRIHRANAAAAEWMSTTPDALAGKAVEHYLQIKSATPLDEIVRRYRTGDRSVAALRVVYFRPGRVVMARAAVCPAEVGEGGAASYLMFIDPGASG